MPDPEFETVSVALMTGVRWSTLPAGARRSAIRGQVRGGGASNPHATLLSLSKGYLTKRHTKVSALRTARRAGDIKKRRYVRHCLKNLMRLIPEVRGTPRPIPPLGRRQGPKGLIELKVAPHVYIEGATDRYIGFWANQDPALNAKSARLYAQMIREGVAPPEGKPCRFEIIDLRHGVHYVHDIEELDDDPSDLLDFLRQMEISIEEAQRS